MTESQVQQYRKKPVVIEVIQFTGTRENIDRVMKFLTCRYSTGKQNGIYQLEIHTLEGVMMVNPGDYIIKGIKGEFYPCKPDIFEATYEGVGA